MVDRIFSFAVRQKGKIIFAFKLFYLLIVTILFIGGRSIYYQDENFLRFSRLGVHAGKTALIFYILTTIPGITRRFGAKHKLIAAIMLFRRYLGISMFLFVLLHYWFLWGIDTFFHRIFQLPPPLFEAMGTTAYFLTLPLFLTSNDFSVKKLGPWWGRIHQLTYVIVWFVFAHVALQRLSIWSILAGITALAQISSHIYARHKRA